MNDPFNQFLALVERDEQYRKLSEAINKQNILIENLIKQKETISKQFSSTKILLEEANKDLKNLEAELEQFAQREKSIKKAISETTSSKDIKILQKELSAIAKPRERAEESLMEALNRVENITRIFNENEAKTVILKSDADAKINDAQITLADLQKQFEQFKEVESQMAEGIPQQWMDLYQRVRKFVPDPVSRLLGNSCSACGYTMTTHEVMTIHKLRVIQCPECYRVLYYKP